MGDRRRHFPERRHPRDMRQVRLRFMQFDLGLLAGGNIRHGPDKFDAT